jgi:hypothetical protein
MKNGRCRMHGGTSPGAPRRNKNALKRRYTGEAILRRREVSVLLRAIKSLARQDLSRPRNCLCMGLFSRFAVYPSPVLHLPYRERSWRWLDREGQFPVVVTQAHQVAVMS